MIRKLIGNQTGPRQFELPPNMLRVRFARLVAHFVIRALAVQHERMVQVIARQRAHAVVGQEFVSVEQPAQQAFQPVSAQQREQPPLAAARVVPARDQVGQLGPVLEDTISAVG